MVTYRSKIGSPVEILSIVADNMNTALDLGDIHQPALGVALALGKGAFEVFASEARLPQRLDPDGTLGIRRGRTFVIDGDASTSETLVFTGLSNRTQRVVLDSDLGQRLVLDVDPGQTRGVSLEPGERVTVHHNFRRP